METTIASFVALAIAGVAAVGDWRRGEITNWITLPPAAISPLLYAFFFGAHHGLISVASLLLCSLVPYALFRQAAMGGGDVKLFAALGAVTGFDVKTGIEIQLAAFVAAMFIAFGALAWKGALVRTLCNIARYSFRRLRRGSPLELNQELLTPIRMGWGIFIGTALAVSPHIDARWIGR